MRTIRGAIALAATSLLLAGCGGADELTEGLDDLTQSLEDELPADDEADGADPADDPGAASETGPAAVDGRSLDVTVHHGGVEWTVQELTVVDLDEGEEQRTRGLELTFVTQVVNPLSETVQPGSASALRWDDPDTGDTLEVRGQADFREVPGESSTTGAFVVTVPPADLEAYDDASARLVIGDSGRSAAQVPIGSDAELIDRLPIPQDDLVGTTLDVDGVEVTIVAAEVRWDEFDGRHVADGEALLELTYDLDNDSGSQSCSTRGTGGWALTRPNGDSIVDLGVTERCVRDGERETGVLTGFLLEGDLAGDHTVRHERAGDTDEATFAIVEGDGVRADDRETR